MTVGDRIRQKRIELGLSVDELAEMLNKNRATIYRYENGDIENLPITTLEPLAEVLRTTPAELMGWDKIKETAHEILTGMLERQEEAIQMFEEFYSQELARVIRNAVNLNERGQAKLLERSQELLEMPKYTAEYDEYSTQENVS